MTSAGCHETRVESCVFFGTKHIPTQTMELLEISSKNVSKGVAQLDEQFLAGNESRCTIRAQGRLINTLVEACLQFRDAHPSSIKIDDITIGTIKGIKVKGDIAKNLSYMRIILVKQ
ncbi:MAG: hypothetical protein ACTSUE_00505 [Promethearchaeota archaeon]